MPAWLLPQRQKPPWHVGVPPVSTILDEQSKSVVQVRAVEHAPPTQVRPEPQALSHSPQWFAFVWVLTHEFPHLAPEAQPHWPEWHVKSPWQPLPQLPQ